MPANAVMLDEYQMGGTVTGYILFKGDSVAVFDLYGTPVYGDASAFCGGK